MFVCAVHETPEQEARWRERQHEVRWLAFVVVGIASGAPEQEARWRQMFGGGRCSAAHGMLGKEARRREGQHRISSTCWLQCSSAPSALGFSLRRRTTAALPTAHYSRCTNR